MVPTNWAKVLLFGSLIFVMWWLYQPGIVEEAFTFEAFCGEMQFAVLDDDFALGDSFG